MPQTLQCPKCNKAVSVSDQAAGQRVNCPHCSQTFLAPGFTASKNDDDDWLSLDDDPVAPTAAPAPSIQASVGAPIAPRPAITPEPAQIEPASIAPGIAGESKAKPGRPKSSRSESPPQKSNSPKSNSPKSNSPESNSPESSNPGAGSPDSGDSSPSKPSSPSDLEDDDLADLMLPPVELKPRPNPNADLANDLIGAATGEPIALSPIDDVEVLEEGVELVDDFTSTVEPVPKASGGDLFGDLPPIDLEMEPATPARPRPSMPDLDLPDMAAPVPATPASTVGGTAPRSSKPAPTANVAEYASEYRVKCNICGTKTYAKASQQGKTIKCTDCHTPMKVPPPPKIKKKVTIDVDNAKTFTFEDSPVADKRPDPYRQSAEDLLDEAEKSDKPTQDSRKSLGGDFDTPDMKQWGRDVFGVFLDSGVLFRWIFLSLVGSVPAFLILSSGSKLLLIALMLGGVLLMAAVVAYGFAIMQSVANRHDSVDSWPESDPTAWADELFLTVAAAGLAGGPVWLMSTILLGGPSLLGAAVTLMSVFVFFPFIILSMMDMQSVFAPFSPEVARSATRCQEAWGGLYLSSGLLFGGLFLTYAGMSAAAPAMAVIIWVFATIAVTFMYFAMIGRLAYAIGQPVIEPAKKEKDDSVS